MLVITFTFGYVVKLQTGDPEVIAAWKKICEVSRRGIAHRYLFCLPTKIRFEAIYKKLGVTCTERGESFYQPLMPEVVKELEAKGQNYTPAC